MSFDGSFSPPASLRRLLNRCPALLSDPTLSSLHQNCNSCSELVLDDLVEALADPFLHPEYTIPIVGCFRPVCERIASRATDKLRAAESLNSDNDTSIEDEIGEDTRVLDFYLRRGRGLRLHEVACLALCRALDLAPFLLRAVLNYFKFSLSPFGRLMFTGVPLPASKKGINLLLEATRLTYRFLVMEPGVFSELWDWSCFLDLLQSLGDLNLTETAQPDVELELRWCTVQILSIVLKSSDKIIENVGLQANEAFICYERWKKFCGDTSIEKAGLYFEGCGRGSSDSIDGIVSSISEIESLESWNLVDSLSELNVSEPGKRKQIGGLCPFILSASMRKTFEVALMAATQKWPVLLYGPVGAGKTAFINKLASGNRVLFIHMDEQMDSRTLVGCFVCTEQPGEFKWNPGSLTQSVLLPLLEGSTSFLTGHGEVVKVSETFRLFATVTTLGTDIEERDAPIDIEMQQTNPFRSIGNALKEYKERAKVSADQDQAESCPDDVIDMDADEYMYVAEGQKNTSQALGAATSDQMMKDVDEGTRPTTDESFVKKREEATIIDTVENPEKLPSLRACNSLVHRGETSDEAVEKAIDMHTPMEEAPAGDSNLQSSQDVVLFSRSYMDEEIAPLDEFLMNGDYPDDDGRIEMSTDEDLQKAVVEWKRHELSTMRMSQELAEQLWLVMEPTVASRLQGDYRTGKRINMKKVIPYIASHFRKDKIWLRRTKPNKRNYQVMIAVDDSCSMSESQCGKVAIEALVTVCRAMSQLEVGQFAVASFGEKGKIKLLHDFDQTFTTEAGIKYLNNMLDMAVARSRTPSGQNPLHQLVLIIADGRFHEKENLRRCVRDVLSRKRMVAFILLDSSQDSITDMMEATFEGDELSFRKYLNSFPFPYYIVLKNIEALPHTLADLLRQWFELMQSLNDN